MKSIILNNNVLKIIKIIIIMIFIISLVLYVNIIFGSSINNKEIIKTDIFQTKSINNLSNSKSISTIKVVLENKEKNEEEVILENTGNISNENIEVEKSTLESTNNNSINKENEENIETKSKLNIENKETQNNDSFISIGKIQIPKTNLDLPILDNVTVKGMEIAPCKLYSTGELNVSGNTLIVGHNYRNNTLFSNNGKLENGDKIYITTSDGKKVEYTVYNKFTTTAEDVSYLKREVGEKPEISIQCCSDDDEMRIIILAIAN